MCSVVFRHLTIVTSFVIIIPFLSYSSLTDAGQHFSKPMGGSALGKPVGGEIFSNQRYRYTNLQTGETNNWSVRVFTDNEGTTVVTEINTSEVSGIGRVRRGYEVYGYNPALQLSAEVAEPDTDGLEHLVSVATDRPYFTEGAEERTSAPEAGEPSPPDEERNVRVVRSPGIRPFLLLGMPMVNPGEIPEMILRSSNPGSGEYMAQLVRSNTQVTFSYDNLTGRFSRIEIAGYGVLEAIERPVSRPVVRAPGGAVAQASENPGAYVPEPLLPELPERNDLNEAAATAGVTANKVSY